MPHPDIVDPKEGGPLSSLSEPACSGRCGHIHPTRATGQSASLAFLGVDFCIVIAFLFPISVTQRKENNNKY